MKAYSMEAVEWLEAVSQLGRVEIMTRWGIRTVTLTDDRSYDCPAVLRLFSVYTQDAEQYILPGFIQDGVFHDDASYTQFLGNNPDVFRVGGSYGFDDVTWQGAKLRRGHDALSRLVLHQNGDVSLVVTHLGAQELAEAFTDTQNFPNAHAIIADHVEGVVRDMWSYYDISAVSPMEIGALTEAPIFAQHVVCDQDGDFQDCEAMWYYDRYMLEDPWEILLRDRAVRFQRVHENT